MDELMKRRVSSRRWMNVVLGISAAVVVPVAVAAAVAAPKVFTSGTAISSADVNANFDGMERRLAALEAAAAATPTSGLLVRQKTNFTLTAGSDTRIDYSQSGVEYDLGGEFDSATDLFTAKKPGIYVVSCGLAVEGIPAGEFLAALIQLNKATYAEEASRHLGGIWGVSRVTATIMLKAGDAVSCAAYAGSAVVTRGDPDFVNGFMVAKL